jgi:hypothetical protein
MIFSTCGIRTGLNSHATIFDASGAIEKTGEKFDHRMKIELLEPGNGNLLIEPNDWFKRTDVQEIL